MEGQVGGETRSVGSKLGGILGGALKGGAIAAGTTAIALLGTALTKGFSRLNAIDQAKAKLSGLGNSAKQVDTIMANALSSVKGTAFGLDEAATTAASAVAAGIKPGKELTGVLKTVADTATIAGASMADTGAIFGSVAARGKLQGDDLMQLQSRGVPVLSFLAKHYGITAKAASKMVSEGKVDFKNFNAAMQENLGGAALKSGETFTGAFANLKASLGRIGANLLSGIFPQVKSGIGKLTKILSGLEPVATKVGEFIGKGVAQIGPILSKAFGVIGPVIDRVKEAFASLGSGGGGGFMTTLQNLAAFVTGTILPAMQAFGGYLMTNIVPVLVRLGQIIATNVVPILASFGQFVVGTIVPALVAIYSNVAARLKPILDQLAATFQAQILPALQMVLAKFREWQPTIQAVIAVVVQIIGKLLEFWASVLGKVLPVVIRFAGFLIGTLVKAVVAVIDVIVRIIGKLLALKPAILDRIQDAQRFVAGVKEKFGEVLDFIGDIPGKIKGFFSDAGHWLLNAGKEIIGGLLRGITEKFEDVKHFVGGIGSWIKDHKGPLSYDRKLLVPAGTAIMGGFNESLRDGMGDLRSTVGDITSAITLPRPVGSLDSASGRDRAVAVSQVRLSKDDLDYLADRISGGVGGAIVGQGSRVQSASRNRPR